MEVIFNRPEVSVTRLSDYFTKESKYVFYQRE